MSTFEDDDKPPSFELLARLRVGTEVSMLNSLVVGISYDNSSYLILTTGGILGQSESALIILDETLLVDLFGEVESEEALRRLQSQPDTWFFAIDKAIAENVDINGEVFAFEHPFLVNSSSQHALRATSVQRHEQSKFYLKGSIILPSDSPTMAGAFLSEKDRLFISEILEPYATEPLLPVLTQLIISQVARRENPTSWIRIAQCPTCDKHFAYWSLELFDDPPEKDNQLLCRGCGAWKYSSLLDSPYSFVKGLVLIDRLTESFTDMIRNDFSKDSRQAYVLSTEGYIPARSIGEATFAQNRLRKLITENPLDYIDNPQAVSARMQQRLRYRREIGDTIAYCLSNNAVEINKMMTQLEATSSPQSNQVTNNIYDLEKDLQRELQNNSFRLLFPHPLQPKDQESLLSFQAVVRRNLKRIFDTYKDLYDLNADHNFLANLGNIYNGKPFTPQAILPSDFGKNLADKTLKALKGTPLLATFSSLYDNKIRNGFGHPGHVVNDNTKEVDFYSHGTLSFSLPIEQVVSRVFGIVDFHQEIVDARTELWFMHYKDILKKQGVLDIQYTLDDVESPEGELLAIQQPSLEVRQYWCFAELNQNADYSWLNVEMDIERPENEAFFILKVAVVPPVIPGDVTDSFLSEPITSAWVVLGDVVFFLWQIISFQKIGVLHRTFFPPLAQFFRANLFPENWEYLPGRNQRLFSDGIDGHHEQEVSQDFINQAKAILAYDSLCCKGCNSKHVRPSYSFVDLKSEGDQLNITHIVVYECLDCSTSTEIDYGIYGQFIDYCGSILFPKCLSEDYYCPFVHRCISRKRAKYQEESILELAESKPFEPFTHAVLVQSGGVVQGIVSLIYDITRYIEHTASPEIKQGVQYLLDNNFVQLLNYMYRGHRSKNVDVEQLSTSTSDTFLWVIGYLCKLHQDRNIAQLQVCYKIAHEIFFSKLES